MQLGGLKLSNRFPRCFLLFCGFGAFCLAGAYSPVICLAVIIFNPLYPSSSYAYNLCKEANQSTQHYIDLVDSFKAPERQQLFFGFSV